MNYNGLKSFADLLPDGDKIFSQYFANSAKGGTDYLIDPLRDASGQTTSFLIYENNGDKDLATRQANGTIVTIDQAKAGNWNPETNKLDVNQTFRISDDNKVVGTVVGTTSTPNSSSTSTGTSGATSSSSSTNTGTSGATPDSSSTNTGTIDNSSGSSSSINDSKLFIDPTRIDNFQSDIKSSYEKMNALYDGIIRSLIRLGNADTENGDITQTVKEAKKVCEDKQKYATSKKNKTISAIKADKDAIERQQLLNDLEAAKTLDEVKKVFKAYIEGGVQ